MLGDLTADAFEPHVGDGWTLVGDGGTELALELIDVERVGSPPGDGRRAPFSLRFLGPPEPILPQATRTFLHPAMGSLGLFVVPIGRRADGRIAYEVVFG